MENFGHSDFSFVKYTFEHGSVWTSFWRWISKEGGKEKKETEAATALKASWRENEQPRESSSSLDTLRTAQWWFFHFLYFLSPSLLFFSHFPDTFQASLAFSKAFQVFILPPPLFTFFLPPFLLHPPPLSSNDFFPLAIRRRENCTETLNCRECNSWLEGGEEKEEERRLKFEIQGNRK